MSYKTPSDIQKFLVELVGRSLKTKSNYSSFANVFFSSIKKPIQEVTPQDVMTFLNEGLEKKKWKLSTVRQYAKVASRFMGEFKDDEWMKQLKKQIRFLPKTQTYSGLYEGIYIKPKDIDKFIKTAPNSDMEIIYTLILKAGLRLTEALYQDITDLQQDTLRIVVRGKGRGTEHKIRSVRISKQVMQKLFTYIGRRRKGPVVQNLKPRNVEYTWKRTAKKIGIPYWQKLTPHDGRHSYAIDFILKRKKEGWAAAVLLTGQLGHSDINVTKIYLDIAGAEADEVFEAGEKQV